MDHQQKTKEQLIKELEAAQKRISQLEASAAGPGGRGKEEKRKKHEIALQESEQHLRLALDATQAGTFSWSIESGLITWDRRLHKIFGLDPDSFGSSYESWATLVHPDDLKSVEEAIRNALDSESTFQHEYRIRRPDGTTRNIRAQAVMIRDENGKALGMTGVCFDVTRYKQAEARILEEKRKAEHYLDIADVIILALDSNARVTLINKKGCDVLGYKEEEIIGKDWVETAIPAGHRGVIRNMFNDIMEEKIDPLRKIPQGVVTTKSGEWRLVSWTNSILRDEDGRIIGTLSSGEDITERKMAEYALKEQELRYRTLFDLSPDGVLIIDPATALPIEFNHTAYEQLGYTREEFAGMRINDYEYQEKAEETLSHVEKILREGRDDFETYHLTKDGRIRNVLVTVQAIELGQSSILYCIFRDITEIRRAQAALEKNERRIRALVENSPIAMLVFREVDKQIVLINKKFQDTMGYAFEDIPDIFQWWSLAYPDDDYRYHMEELWKARMEEATVFSHRTDPLETRITCKDGTVKTFQAHRTSIGEESLIVFVNLTELREAEHRLTEVLDLNQKIIAESSSGILACKAVGTCVLANESTARILGTSVEEILKKDSRQVILWQHSGLQQVAEKVLATGQPQRLEAPLTNFEGKEVWLDCNFASFTSSGEPHLLLVINDITERRQAERVLLEAKQAADAANRAKSDFLARMSHEIRTPMNAVTGLCHLMLQTHLDSKQYDYMKKIQNSAHILLNIINDILDYSKIEAGKLEIESVPFNLDDVIAGMAGLVGLQADKKGLEIFFDMGKNVPLDLIGDPLRLGQVLINLINNAVKFTEFGEIVVKTERIGEKEEDQKVRRLEGRKVSRIPSSDLSTLSPSSPLFFPDQVLVRFSVKDTGIGLTQEQMDKLFDSFSQADGSITRKYGGTGLGLAISKRLVHLMGGEIGVESEPGRGSTFFFTLPFGLQKEKKTLLPSEEIRGMKVLVVDDNATSREILCSYLEAFGFRVNMAASGEEAIRVLEASSESDPFRIVLMDWKMPYPDGIETSERIRKNPHLGLIPTIIMVTAYGREEIMLRASEAGLDGFLVKPVNRSVLFDTIMEVCGRKIENKSRYTTQGTETAELLERIRGARILLVEDNEVNQQVARELLENAGLTVVVANNGREAVNKVKEDKFDAVLMDLEMPEMDGYEATRRIREAEGVPAPVPFPVPVPVSICGHGHGHGKGHGKGQGSRPTPIIAMTAHAMTTDREKCLEAGMNDHTGKPIEPAYLFAILDKWIGPLEKTARMPLPTLPETRPEDPFPVHLPGIDVKSGLEKVAGNKKLFGKVIVDFCANFADIGNEIRRLTDRGEKESALRLVHNLKGASGNIGALAVHGAAVALEQAIENQEIEDIRKFRKNLEVSLEQVAQSVELLKNNQVKGDAASDQGTETDLSKAAPLLVKVAALVAQSSLSAGEPIEELKRYLGHSFRKEMEELEKSIEGLDYDTALSILLTIAKELGIPVTGGVNEA